MLAGARLTVILLTGKTKPEFLMAVLTRSLDSLTAESGRPTISKQGSPELGNVIGSYFLHRRKGLAASSRHAELRHMK